MGGEITSPPIKQTALLALERGDDDAAGLIARALAQNPTDGSLIIAHAAARLRAGEAEPFADLEKTVVRSPEWIEGHKALCRLRAEANAQNPFASIESALEAMPKKPSALDGLSHPAW